MRGLRSRHSKESKPSRAMRSGTKHCSARQRTGRQCRALPRNAQHFKTMERHAQRRWRETSTRTPEKGTVHHNNVAPLFSTLRPPIDTPRKPPWTPRFNIGGFREAWKTRGLTQQCCAAGGLSMASCSAILKQGGRGGIGCVGLHQRLGPYCLLDRWRNIIVISRRREERGERGWERGRGRGRG